LALDLDRPGHAWSIRSGLRLERRLRDLVLFNLATDNKLRGCDLIVSGVATTRAADRTTSGN
jgi:hypothetical protein